MSFLFWARALRKMLASKPLCTCSVRKTRTRSRPHPSIWRSRITKVQCDFSSAAYSPDHTKALRLININNTTGHQTIKLHHFHFVGVVLHVFVIFRPNFPVDSLNSNFHFFPSMFCCKQLRWYMQMKEWGTCRGEAEDSWNFRICIIQRKMTSHPV